MKTFRLALLPFVLSSALVHAQALKEPGPALVAALQVPAEFVGKLGPYADPLKYADGRTVKTAADWQRRRAEILAQWTAIMGEWPAVLEKPKVEVLETTQRDGFTQHKVRVQIAPQQ